MIACDVLVIGGGPAGASVATLCAREGAEVVVVERDRFPRNKVCGEFVAPEGCRVLDELGVLDRLLHDGAVWMDRFRMTDRKGRSVSATLPDLGPAGHRALGVSRSRMDHVVLDAARAAGARVLDRHFASAPLRGDGRVTGFRVRPAGGRDEREIRAQVVVAADGRRSVLARALHPELCDPPRSDPLTWFGLKAHFRGHSDALDSTVELHLFDGGYAGLSHVEDDRVNLALVVTVESLRAHDGSPDLLLAGALSRQPGLSTVLDGRARVTDWKSVGPLRFGARRPAAAGALFAGDAAGTVDPFCGEGMAHALAGARIAAPYALRAAARGGLTDDEATSYSKRWRDAFGRIGRRNRLLGRLFEHPRLSDAVLGLLSRGPDWVVPALVRSTRTGVRALAPAMDART